MMETLCCITGTIKKIIYQKDSFVILLLSCPDSCLSSPRGGLKAKGDMVLPVVGMCYFFSGKIETHYVYGDTFCFSDYTVRPPRGDKAIQLYLTENCNGVGPVTAKHMTDVFGEKTLQICREKPELVAQKVKGVKDKIEDISKFLKENEEKEKLVVDLKKICLDTRIGKKVQGQIIEEYRNKTICKIHENPYRLTNFHGVGFHKADHVARNIGFKITSPFRIKAGIFYILEEAANKEGHTCLEKVMIVERGTDLLTLEKADVNTVLTHMVIEKELAETISEKGISQISLKHFYKKEKEIAEKIKEMIDKNSDFVDIDITDKDEQVVAVKQALRSKIFIITGAAGTGKTYTVREIISNLHGLNYAIAAPTGKAAARLNQLNTTICHVREATTIHRLLKSQKIIGGKWAFLHNKENPLIHDLIILDETSMIDVNLFHSLISALQESARLILIGDTYQLPPVGPGNVLRDLLSFGVSSIELKRIRRQTPGLILTNCHNIKNGRQIEYTNEKETNFFIAKTKKIDKIREIILSLATSSRLKDQFRSQFKEGKIDMLRDVQILSPVREKTEISCKAINLMIQGIINERNKPDAPEKNKLWLGDKVIQLKNDYGNNIVNGDIGFVSKVEHREITVDFENPVRKRRLGRYKNDLDLAYALTVHKYQGSECPIVIIPIHKCFGPLIMQRNWLYTAVSRASIAIILVGQVDEFDKIIARNKQARRLTRLKEMLQNGTF